MYLCPGSTRLSSHMVELGVAWVTTVLFCLLPSILEVSTVLCIQGLTHGRLRLSPFSLPSKGLKVRKEEKAKENECPFLCS